MKQLYLFIALLTTLSCYSRSENEKTQIYFSEGIEINLKKVDCIDKAKGIEKQILVIELINTNSYPVNISFNKELWYDNNCQTCNSNSDEYTVSLPILENSTVVGDCIAGDKSLSIFVKMLNLENVRQLTKYELKNITIEKAN
ncbi:MAG: hypothetical protein HYU69_15870 [Bacteroidetes bacterium]|nr:hypothetical protein [Bacteroidota bacterium]